MAIRDTLIKAVDNLGGNKKRIVTISDGVREMAAAMGASTSKLSAATNIDGFTQ